MQWMNDFTLSIDEVKANYYEFIDNRLQANRGFNEHIFFEHYYFDYVVNWIKRDFRVSYTLAIKQLLKSKFEYKKYLKDLETAERFYKECLLRSENEYENKTPYIDNEPFPLSLDLRAYDAARFLEYKDYSSFLY